MKRIIDDEFLSLLETRDLCIDHPMNGLFGGERLSKKYGASLDFADYRDYLPGDDLRLIDRNVYARFEKLCIKLFYDERQLFHRIYIDASSSMSWGEPPKSETAIKLAAALSYLSVRSNDRVAISLFKKTKTVPLCPPFSGTNAFYAAADQLNRVRFSGEADFSRALLCEEEPGRDDGISVIISDFMNDGYEEAIKRLIYRGRTVHLIQVLSPDEADPDLRGKAFLRDSESLGEDDVRNFRMTISHQRIKAYKEALRVHQSELKNFCRKNNIGFFTVLSDTPIEKVLFGKAMEERLIT